MLVRQNRLVSSTLRVIGTRALSSNKGLQPNEKDVQMPTPLSIGFDITFQQANSNSPNPDGARRPLAVVAGWLGAKPRQLKPYLEFYHKNNIDTLSFAVGPHHILFPTKAEEQMEKVLEFCAANNKDTKPVDSLLFHHFSVGGYLFGQMLRVLESKPGLAPKPGVIKGQVFDSPPDFRGIAKGVSRSMGVGPPFSKGIEWFLRAYLAATANTSVGIGHRASSAAFHNNAISAPALWFYSKSDPVANWEDCEVVINKWKARGTSVEQCIWDHSPHIQHGRVDPERYFGTLQSFLEKQRIIGK